MNFYNINNYKEIINFKQALKIGLGKNQGLFFPSFIPKINLKNINQILDMDFINRSSYLISLFIKDEISLKNLTKIIHKAFNFPLKLINIKNNIFCLELFHGPTLSFKDFGVRFMSQILNYFTEQKKIIILTATSGDTGAAVAHAFYNINNIEVIILYPKNKISVLQEKLFCTLGKNIKTIAIEGNFDDCQKLVKQSFEDTYLRNKVILNSANSINISRLIAQICYYFEAFAKIKKNNRNNVIVSIPCGNFGNLTAGLIAKSMGLPIKKFIAATNSNDTVLRYLKNGIWKPKKTITTLSNAMDVNNPNNWPRILELFKINNWNLNRLSSQSISDNLTEKSIIKLYNKYKYITEPHSAIAYHALSSKIKCQEDFGIFLGTAHPAKFQDYIDKILKIRIKLPIVLTNYIKKENLSYNFPNNFTYFKTFLIKNYI
ncbi:threonine synthase [Enterobacteriaceae endosymbiont of Plateumaris consimilis]|uniref:threonine synthase n=1 Tax=Enterobacteriaceae endosymbiont of Plateumaris consimilis TaxID=2675794 RepID=UPI00144A1164|nr:threonine synthase [Enterobacteriaceae endosymbiont of Plateumaris consimilis]QJC28776.1 threonine synthase [Enterobacteriaceae endosymbiont of Plateumaris consimilis]